MVTDINKTMIKALKITGGIMMAATVGAWICLAAGKTLGTALVSNTAWIKVIGICGLALWEIGSVMSKMEMPENGISRSRGMISTALMALGAILGAIVIMATSLKWLFWLAAAVFFIGMIIGEADDPVSSPDSDSNS